MSSAEELSKFAAERSNASADIGDVGFEFGAIAAQRGLAAPYKPSTWSQVPGWAKDKDGLWMLAYTGTISFAVASDMCRIRPKSWADLLTGKLQDCRRGRGQGVAIQRGGARLRDCNGRQ